MEILFYTAGGSPALTHAIHLLKQAGIPFTRQTDLAATHLLCPVPSFSDNSQLVGGGHLETVLPQLSKDITIVGGNLNHPALKDYKTIDLLQDDTYVAANAQITAHCALRYAMEHLPVTLQHCPVLILGWGRIGKCLGRLLSGLGAKVTVATRKSADRAMAQALGYQATPIDRLNTDGFRLIYNTIPVMVLPQGSDALCIDLASKAGIGGSGVLHARGLPGKDAPESSGQLIAETVLRLLN